MSNSCLIHILFLSNFCINSFFILSKLSSKLCLNNIMPKLCQNNVKNVFIFFNLCNTWAVLFWNLFDAHASQSITSQLCRLFCCPEIPDAGYLVCSCTWLQLCAEFGPLHLQDQASYFCIQACHSIPRKHLPLEALHSIVSACSRDLPHNKSWTNGVRVHRTVTSGATVEGARCLKKLATPCKKAHFVAGEYGGVILRV